VARVAALLPAAGRRAGRPPGHPRLRPEPLTSHATRWHARHRAHSFAATRARTRPSEASGGRRRRVQTERPYDPEADFGIDSASLVSPWIRAVPCWQRSPRPGYDSPSAVDISLTNDQGLRRRSAGALRLSDLRGSRGDLNLRPLGYERRRWPVDPCHSEPPHARGCHLVSVTNE
jgi:hypothetical protein